MSGYIKLSSHGPAEIESLLQALSYIFEVLTFVVSRKLLPLNYANFHTKNVHVYYI